MNLAQWSVPLALCLASWPALAQWTYRSVSDPMGGGDSKFAVAKSENSLDLGFPYAGVNHGRLVVRKHPQHGLDVMFGVDKGQLVCRVSECGVLIRFDDGKATVFEAATPADHSADLLFLKNPRRFIENAKKAKTIRAQATFFRNGAQVLVFQTPGGLDWK